MEALKDAAQKVVQELVASSEKDRSSWSKDKLFSSDRQDWATPWSLFEAVNKEFNFKLDAAAAKHNAKVDAFISEEENSLDTSWWDIAGDDYVWLNPPYGREIGQWIKKAYIESTKGCKVVCLTFCRTDTQWWHKWAMRAAEIRLIPGRITFEGADNSAPAPSCLLIFDESKRLPTFTTQSLPRK